MLKLGKLIERLGEWLIIAAFTLRFGLYPVLDIIPSQIECGKALETGFDIYPIQVNELDPDGAPERYLADYDSIMRCTPIHSFHGHFLPADQYNPEQRAILEAHLTPYDSLNEILERSSWDPKDEEFWKSHGLWLSHMLVLDSLDKAVINFRPQKIIRLDTIDPNYRWTFQDSVYDTLPFPLKMDKWYGLRVIHGHFRKRQEVLFRFSTNGRTGIKREKSYVLGF